MMGVFLTSITLCTQQVEFGMQRAQTSLLFPVFTCESMWTKRTGSKNSIQKDRGNCKKSDLANRKGEIIRKEIFANFKRIKIKFKAIQYCFVL